MRLRRRLLVPTLALVAICGWGADAPSPVATLDVADGKDLNTHFALTPWAKVWADPASKPLHDQFDAWQAEAAQTLGGTPTDLLLATTNTGVTVFKGPDQSRPVTVLGHSDVSTFATKLYSLIRQSLNTATEATVAGADQAAVQTGPHGDATLARFATALTFAFAGQPVKPQPRGAQLSSDVVLGANIPDLFDLIAQAVPETAGGSAEGLASARASMQRLGISNVTYRMSMIREGFLERIEAASKLPEGYKPVDRQLLARLPANTLMAAGVGFDGAAYWRANRTTLLAQWAPKLGTDPKDPVATEQAADAWLAGVGVPVHVADLVSGWVGTSLLALSPGVPFPALSIAIPRSPANDQLIATALGMVGTQAPAEGSSTLVPLPNVPVPVTLVCDKATWFLSSDTAAAEAWLAAKPTGYADTAAMKLATSKAPADAYILGASDTPNVLRLISGYAGMALGMAKSLPMEQRQAILQSLNILTANASSGYIYSGTQDGTQVTECRSITGVFSGVAFAGVVAGIALPAINKSRHHDATAIGNGNDGGAEKPRKSGPAHILKTVVFPAEVQFQAGAYIDQDGDGIGEYGLLSELSGRRMVTGDQTLALIEGPLSKGAVAGGYAFTIYLPGATNRVADDGKKEPRAAVKADADLQEKQFVAYAWPSRAKEGKVFALLADGSVYETTYSGTAPAWNAVFGGQGWDAKPAWPEAGSAPEPVEAPPQPTPNGVVP